MEAEASQAGTYPHAAAWLGGVFLAGIAVVTAALCGTIAILVRNAPITETARPIGSGPTSVAQIAGLVVLFIAGCGYAISHAASQEAGRLPHLLVRLVARTDWLLGRIPPMPKLRGSLETTTELSRLVAVVGPFASSAIAAVGTWLASGLGWRALLVGGAVAGATAAGAAILVEPHDTSIQSGGMVVALVVGSFAGFGLSTGAMVTAAAGAVWIILVAEVTDAVVQRGTAWVTVLLGGIALATSSVLAELDNTLASLTVSGTQPRSFADIAPLLSPAKAPGRAREVAATWLDFRTTVTAKATGEITPPTDLSIRSLYALIDSAGFALATALLLIAACAFLLARLDRSEEGGKLRSILTVTRFTIPVLFAVDVAENLSGAAAVLPHGISRSATASDLDGVAGLASEIAYLHWLMALSKWVIIIGALVAIVASALWLVVVQRRRTVAAHAAAGPDAGGGGVPPESPIATAWRSVRAHVVLVVVLAFAVRNAQAMDAIRLLAKEEFVAPDRVVALACAVAFAAVAIRYLAELIGREVGHLRYIHAAHGGSPAGTARALPARLAGWPLIGPALRFIGPARSASEQETDKRVWFGTGIGAVASVMAAYLGAPGLLIPVALWAVIELLSIPLRPVNGDGDAERDRRRRARRRSVVAGFAIAAVVGVAGLASLAGGAPAVRLLLAAVSLGVAFVALVALIPFGTVRGEWFGLRPAIRTCCGVIPFCRIVLPGVARRTLVAARWFVRSVLRRLVLPLAWLLDRIGVRSAVTRTVALAERLATALVSRMTRRADAGPAPVGAEPSSGAEPPPAAPAGTADAILTAQHAASIGRVLGALTPMLVGAAIVRAALGLVIYAPDRSGGTWLLIAGVGLVLAGPLVHGLPRLRETAWGRGDGVAAVTLALALVFATYLIGWQVVSVGNVIGTARTLGAVGVLCVGLAMFALIATTIAYLGDATESLPSLQLIRIRRSPFFAFAIAWVLIAGVIDSGGYHSIDTHADAGTPPAAEARVTAADAFSAWAAECADPASGRQAVPMVFVAATGGGIRAAYWTATALEEFDHRVADEWQDDAPCSQPIFAVSGASGGSLGLATYAVQHLGVQPTANHGTVAERLNEDYLAPTVAWMLMADLVRPFFLWDRDGADTVDRAGVLEVALQKSWKTIPPLDPEAPTRCDAPAPTTGVWIGTGLREAWCLGAPLVILNGAEVNSACRFNVSVLDNGTAIERVDGSVDPSPASCRRTPGGIDDSDAGDAADPTAEARGPLGATVDLDDYLCDGADVSMSTAALLSARFPFITPSGRVPACQDALDAAYVVDGGYLDNSGAASLVELWAEVSTYVDTHNAAEDAVCIVPVFIQIDNGYEFDSGTSPNRPSELTLPLSTVFESRGSRESEAKQVAASIFSPSTFSGDQQAVDGSERPVQRWDRLVPEAHPGVQAPLGWALSDAARADLDDQLGEENFARIDRWLDPALACRPPEQ